MEKRWYIALGLLIIAAVTGSQVLAALTGVIMGQVTDNTGNTLPGVTVTVTGANLQGSRSDFTNENGVFRIPDLPPGDYTVRAEMMGMSPVEKTGVRVSLNKTLKLNFEMQLEKLEETITVSASRAAVIDVTTPTQAVNITREFTERLPGSDQFQDAFGMAGGVNGGGNVRVHGSASTDNLYLFDGVDATDPLTSTFGSNINADAIEEVEVQTAGFSAEYGRTMGGIVNVVTKSGGNKFAGVARIKYVNSDWQEDYDHGTAAEKTEYFEPTLTLEGPIVKDMLWFMATYRYTKVDETAQVIAGNTEQDPDNPDLYTGVDTSSVWHYPYAKLTFQPVMAHKFVANYNTDSAIIHGLSGSSFTPEAQRKQEQGGPFYSVEWTFLPNSKLYFVTRLGMSNSFLNSMPDSENASDPSYYDRDTGVTYNNYTGWSEDKRNKMDLTSSASYYIDDFHGSHDTKFGLQFQRNWVEELNKIPGGYNYVMDGDVPYERTSIINPGSTEYSGDYMAIYAQDNWNIGSGFTANVGLRLEYSKFYNDEDSSDAMDRYGRRGGAKMELGPMFAPRLGVTWDIGEQQLQKLSLSYARYYNPFDLSLPGMFLSGEGTTLYRKERYNPETGTWRVTQEDSPAYPNRLDADLKPEYTDELTMGYDRSITENFGVGVLGTMRKTRDIIEDAGLFLDEDGNEVATYMDEYDPNVDDYFYHIYYVTNPEGAKRDYYGVEMNAKARLSNLNLQASYTYSVAKGVVIEAQPGYSGIAQFSGYYDTPSLSQNLYGELPWDATHYLKLDTSYLHKVTDWYSVSVGFSGFYRSGYAYSMLAAPEAPDQDGDGKPDYEVPYGSYRWALPKGRGTYRLPSVYFIDLSLQNEFSFGKFGSLAVIFDVFNLLDNQAVLSRADAWNPKKPELFNQDNGWASPRSYQLSVKYAF